jgi:processive 1,2-diacylglycerol beta-glucosyltransferase
MRSQGIPSDRIHVTGIPVMPSFAECHDRELCAGKLGIDPARRTILLMGGGAGLGSLAEVAARLLSIKSDFQLIALAGRNATALAALQELAHRYPGRLHPQGFTDRVDHLMACADIAVTKPGGLTVSECLASGLPLILNSPIPGQEERNADFLLEQGVALKASDPVTLEYRVRYLFGEPDVLAAMRRRARALGRPDAAKRALSILLAHQGG